MASTVAESLVILLIFPTFVSSIPANNGVLGDPNVLCGPNSIGIDLTTESPFEGHVFVKEKFTDPLCRTDATGVSEAQIELKFDSCGLSRLRSAQPRGIFVSTTVIVTFHPNFITKADKVYMVQCFYMESNKIVSSQLEVGMLTTQLQTQSVPMPVCKYEVLDGAFNANPIKYVQIGQKVYHKWTCDTEFSGVFCMTVHTCTVDDGTGDTVDLIDENGCAIDPHLLSNLDYISDLMVGKESHAFKYADRVNLYFDCQIAIAIKEPYQSCIRPTCPTLAIRGKRQASEIEKADVFLNSTGVLAKQLTDKRTNMPVFESGRASKSCFSKNAFYLFVTFHALLLITSYILVHVSVNIWQSKQV